MPRLLSEAEVVGTDIWIKAYSYALVLTVRSPEKISIVSKTKQRRSALGMLYLYSPCYARLPMVHLHDRHNECIGIDIFISA